jgi:hypothetical protein
MLLSQISLLNYIIAKLSKRMFLRLLMKIEILSKGCLQNMSNYVFDRIGAPVRPVACKQACRTRTENSLAELDRQCQAHVLKPVLVS